MGAQCAVPCNNVETREALASSVIEDASISVNPKAGRHRPRFLNTGTDYSTEAGDDQDAAASDISPSSPGHYRRGRSDHISVSPELINHTIQYLWADISKFAVTVMGRTVQPAVQKALGPLGSKFSFKLENCHLGDEPVRFSEMDHTLMEEEVPSGTMRSLVWTGKVDWKGNLNIVTSFSGIHMGITAINLKGVLVMQAVGMIPQPPFFRGAHAFFINPPDLDITFQGKIKQIIEGSQLVKAKILEVANSKIASLVVVPNSIGSLLDKSADYFEVMRPSPKGLLQLIIHRAEKLPAMDIAVVGSKSSDPYVEIRCGAQRVKSDVQKKTLNPTFNYVAYLRIFSPLHQEVKIDFWDEDFGKRDDFLCGMKIAVTQLIESAGTGEFRVKLLGEKAGDAVAWISTVWTPLSAGLPAPDSKAKHPHLKAVQAVLFCGIYDITRVPWEVEGSEYWVSVYCTTDLRTDHVESTRKVARKKRAVDESQVLLTKQKMELLLKHDVPPDVLAQVFDLPLGPLREKVLSSKALEADQKKLTELEAGRCEKIEYNHSSSAFLVSDIDKASLKFEVHVHPPGGKDRSLGTCSYSVKELAHDNLGKAVKTFYLEAQGVYLKAKMEVFAFADPDMDGKKPRVSDVFAAARMEKS